MVTLHSIDCTLEVGDMSMIRIRAGGWFRFTESEGLRILQHGISTVCPIGIGE